MSMIFGWWDRDAEGRKYQVRAVVGRGAVEWSRKQGHHQSWEPLVPVTDQEWDTLVGEASRRVPRRLISPKQFEEIKRLRPE
jgi:hypothetical protein